MGFAICTRNLPYIRTYEAALRFYNEAKPFKDSTHRPLETRRMQHKAIYMRNDGSQAIALRLFQTDMATYFPNGDVHLECHNSQSSHNFMREYVPAGLRVQRQRVQRQRGLIGIVLNGDFLVPKSGPLKFSRVNNEWVLQNPENVRTFERTTMCRKAAARVRRQLAPFEKWAKTFITLKGSNPDVSFERCLFQRDLADILEADEIPQAAFPALLNAITTWGWHSFDACLQQIHDKSYIAAGAFVTETMPFGATPKRIRHYI